MQNAEPSLNSCKFMHWCRRLAGHATSLARALAHAAGTAEAKLQPRRPRRLHNSKSESPRTAACLPLAIHAAPAGLNLQERPSAVPHSTQHASKSPSQASGPGPLLSLLGLAGQPPAELSSSCSRCCDEPGWAARSRAGTARPSGATGAGWGPLSGRCSWTLPSPWRWGAPAAVLARLHRHPVRRQVWPPSWQMLGLGVWLVVTIPSTGRLQHAGYMLVHRLTLLCSGRCRCQHASRTVHSWHDAAMPKGHALERPEC